MATLAAEQEAISARMERSAQEGTLQLACGPDYLRFFDQDGEIAYWTEQEWIDDPGLRVLILDTAERYDAPQVNEV